MFMSKDELMTEELKSLRDEMTTLKECQTKYISLAVTASGAIFAYLIPNLVEVLQSSVNPKSSSVEIINKYHVNPMFLVPLVIIFPISCIFFSKAVTLFRIVGYYQLLEESHLNPNSLMHFIGWENSMKLFRANEGKSEYFIKKELNKTGIISIKTWDDLPVIGKLVYFSSIFGLYIDYSTIIIKSMIFLLNIKLINKITGFLFGITLEDLRILSSRPPKNDLYVGSSQSYWRLVFYIFFLIAILCFFLTIMPSFIYLGQSNITVSEILNVNKFYILLTLIFFDISVIVFRHILKVLYQLERGFYSDVANYIFWKTVLSNRSINFEGCDYCSKRSSSITMIFLLVLNFYVFYIVLFGKILLHF